jgi:dihydropteroate synthase
MRSATTRAPSIGVCGSRIANSSPPMRAALDHAGLHHVAISIDTTRPDVARAALDAGAALINDVSAGRDAHDALFHLAAERCCPLVLMHMLDQPATMQQAPHYDDVVAQVLAFLLQRAAAAQAAGVPGGQIVIDPGLGFGKTLEHNLALLAHLDHFTATGYPVLIGASRKRMIDQLTSRTLGPHAPPTGP